MSELDSSRKEAEVDKERQDLDSELTAQRAEVDEGRLADRELRDGTRQATRGNRQALESLRRERAKEDYGLLVEREASDRGRSKERSVLDAHLAREKQARSDAEEQSRSDVDREARRTRDLGEVLSLVETQIEGVTARLAAMLATVPRGTFEGQLSDGVSVIRSATARIRELLEDALDPSDSRRRYHDEGGSG
jgi:hypothetical protein